MLWNDIKKTVESAWDNLETTQKIEKTTLQPVLDLVLEGLTSGEISAVKRQGWEVQRWIKKAILLMFRTYDNQEIEKLWWDKIPLLKHSSDFVRRVPGSWIRKGAYLAPSVIVMPAFINIAAYIDEGSMIDSGTTIGACAFIGKRCHISSTVTIGGVLEPLQQNPVIIEDDCFVGAGSHVLEGMHVEAGSVLAAGVILSASTKIVTRSSGKIHYGYIPSGSVVVPGSLTTDSPGVALNCAVIVKTVDSQTRLKTSLTELLRI